MKQVKLSLKYRQHLTKSRTDVSLIFNTMTTKNFAFKYFFNDVESF